MGKQPVRMKAVVYALSPFQQKVMSGLLKDPIGKLTHKVEENWINALLLITPLAGTYLLDWGLGTERVAIILILGFAITVYYSRMVTEERIAGTYRRYIL